MKKASSILTLLLLWTLVAVGQPIERPDSLKIMSAVASVFTMLKTVDYKMFKKHSTNSIYCMPCSSGPETRNPYMRNRKYFFNKHLKEIIQSDYFIRATQSNEIILTGGHDPLGRADVIVLFTIYQPNELAHGHGGGQFGLYLKKEKGEYKFSGLETLP